MPTHKSLTPNDLATWRRHLREESDDEFDTTLAHQLVARLMVEVEMLWGERARTMAEVLGQAATTLEERLRDLGRRGPRSERHRAGGHSIAQQVLRHISARLKQFLVLGVVNQRPTLINADLNQWVLGSGEGSMPRRKRQGPALPALPRGEGAAPPPLKLSTRLRALDGSGSGEARH
jgi:hypothetical protein